MAYKLVKTHEKSSVCFSAVPEKWERNKILRWPQNLNIKQLDKLRADPNSSPSENWTRSACTVVAVATTFVEERQLEIQFSNFSDTEAEDLHMQQKQQNKRVRKQAIFSGPQKDFDKMFDDEVTTGDITPENVQTTEIEECTQVSNNGNLQEVNILETGEETEIREVSVNEFEEISISQVLMGFQETILKMVNQMECFENRFNKLDKSVVEINVKLDRLLQNSPSANVEMPSDMGNELVETFHFPLKEITELENLNTSLHVEEALKSQLISRLSRIGGRSKTVDGGFIYIIYKIIDYLFEPELMLKYSWTGSSKSREQKFSFQKYSQIIDVIFEVIYMADCRYSKARNEEFLRDKILKHTLQRLQRKRKSEVKSQKSNEMLPDKENENPTNIDHEVHTDDGDVETFLPGKRAK